MNVGREQSNMREAAINTERPFCSSLKVLSTQTYSELTIPG